MTNDYRQVELFAWIGEDELGTNEIGLKQGMVPAGCIPIVATKRAKADTLAIREQMVAQGWLHNKTIRLCRFVFAEQLLTAGLPPPPDEARPDAEPVRRLNPNHPTIQFMENDQWIKIVSLLMYREGLTKTLIPASVVTEFSKSDCVNMAIRFTDAGIELHRVDYKEAQRLAKQEGGLPV